MTAVTHPRLAPRRGASGGTWWSKAVLRAVEEAAYAEADLRAGRALADSVLARGEAALTELSNDELRDLVELRPGGGW